MGETTCIGRLLRRLPIHGFRRTQALLPVFSTPRTNMVIFRFFPFLSRIPVLGVVLLLALGLFPSAAQAAHRHHKAGAKGTHKGSKARALKKRGVAAHSSTRARVHGRTLRRAGRGRHHGYVQTWDEPTYADSTAGDNLDGEDLNVRRAAVEGLGRFNGSVVVVDPATGRILTMVNQKLALGGGFQPCSTIKLSVALAGLKENVVPHGGLLKIASRNHMDLTQAIARSNNFYFASLGEKLGYERVAKYAREFGYGEKAGWEIQGEHAGYFPSSAPKNGGVGMLSSFGEEITQTPLELAGLVSAIANGGTLYYLQYPRSEAEIKNFQPRLKRQLPIADLIPEIKPGMQGAVEFGTARRAKQDARILGKTGTCSQGRTRLGWFGSFNEVGGRKLVVVVLLTGGRPSIGPMAAGVAGDVYRRMVDQKILSVNQPLRPENLVATQICCGGR